MCPRLLLDLSHTSRWQKSDLLSWQQTLKKQPAWMESLDDFWNCMPINWLCQYLQPITSTAHCPTCPQEKWSYLSQRLLPSSSNMKYFKKLVLAHISASLLDNPDPLQSAYIINNFTENATIRALHSAIDNKNTYIMMLITGYGSASTP